MAQVPFVDALNTILDPSLPLTVTEWEEWGDPLHDPRGLRVHEVVHAVRERRPRRPTRRSSPSTSLNDTRVTYHEPAKWVARLRATAQAAARSCSRPRWRPGHGGRSGRYDAWHEEALVLAWVVHATAGIHYR